MMNINEDAPTPYALDMYCTTPTFATTTTAPTMTTTENGGSNKRRHNDNEGGQQSKKHKQLLSQVNMFNELAVIKYLLRKGHTLDDASIEMAKACGNAKVIKWLEKKATEKKHRCMTIILIPSGERYHLIGLTEQEYNTYYDCRMDLFDSDDQLPIQDIYNQTNNEIQYITVKEVRTYLMDPTATNDTLRNYGYKAGVLNKYTKTQNACEECVTTIRMPEE